jgi:hypothetical protein
MKSRRITKKQINSVMLRDMTVGDFISKVQKVDRNIKKQSKKFDKSFIKFKETLDLFDVAEAKLQNLSKNLAQVLHQSVSHMDAESKDKKIKDDISKIKNILERKFNK